MLLFQLGEIIMDHWVLALFWMLIHSLWQGLFIASLTFILLHLFKNKPAYVRYWIIISGMIAFVLSVSGTLLFEINQSINSVTSLSQSGTTIFHSNGSAAFINKTPNAGIYLKVDNLANRFGFYIVLAWFICYLFHCIRFVSGLIYIKKLSGNTFPAGAIWESNLLRLKLSLQLNKPIKIFQSAKIQVPVIIGVLKPMILIPVSVANQLPLAEVEAILIHELAHIKRNDFLVNLIQTVIENMFFFNPAIRWMSARLREEREKCCDDIVISQSHGTEAYVNALIRFQESIMARSTFEMALGTNQFQLFKRIKRIINKDNNKTTIMDKTIFFFSILSITTLGFMSGNLTKQNPTVFNKDNSSSLAKSPLLNKIMFVADTVPNKKDKVEDKNEKMEIKKKIDQEIREKIQLDAELKNEVMMEKKIQLEQHMNEYKQMIRNKEIAQRMQMDQMKKMMNGQADQEKLKLEQEQMQLQQQLLQKDLQMKVEALNKEREHMSADQQKELDEKLILLQKEAEVKNMKMQTEIAYLQNMKSQQMAEQMQMQKEQVELLKMEREKNRKVSINGDNSEIDQIVSELLESKIIEKTDPLSFKLNSRQFIVNDKKQGQEIFNELKERFIRSSGDYIEYSHHGGSTSTTIHRD